MRKNTEQSNRAFRVRLKAIATDNNQRQTKTGRHSDEYLPVAGFEFEASS